MTITTLPLWFLATLSLPVWFAWDPLLSYFTAAFLLVMGVGIATKKAPLQAKGLDKIILLGPVLIAMPMAVFGTEHFLDPAGVSQAIPAWMPAHIFRVYLVGACLILGGLSIVVQRHARLAAGCFGVMLLFFELIMHIPRVVAAPHSRIAWAIAIRDLSFSCGALSLAVTRSKEWETTGKHWLISTARVGIGGAVVFFAVEQFLHPECAPAIPLRVLTPTSIPFHLFWPYLTGVIYVVAGVCLIINKKTHLAAAWIGLIVILIAIIIYVPIMIQKGDIGRGLNPVVDVLLLSGAVFCLAGSQRE